VLLGEEESVAPALTIALQEATLDWVEDSELSGDATDVRVMVGVCVPETLVQ